MSRESFNPENAAEGAFQAPPEHAPREVAQPLSPDLIAEQQARAAANERTLAPFAPTQRPVVPETPASIMGHEPPTTLHATPREGERTHQPAASNSDSPSRGVPKPIADPGKIITGGFGHALEAQYFPITGEELRELVLALMDQLHTRLRDDLRFHMAITYPRVRARVVVEVEGWANQGNFEVATVQVHEKTPLEVARVYGDQVAFALVELRQEMTPEGVPENPPDRIRDELGLVKPQKQYVSIAGGKDRVLVDLVAPSVLDSAF